MYTVEQWMEVWLTLRAPELKPRSMESYRDLTVRYVVPALGTIDLKELSGPDIKMLLASIQAAGHYRTAEMVYVLLRAALVDLEPNPLKHVHRPKHTQKSPVPWSDQSIAAYLEAVKGSKHCLALSCGLLLGLRRGEICGLRWQDIDFDRGLIHIVNQRQRLQHVGVVDCTPKTEASIRTLPIPRELLPLLESERKNVGYVCSITPSGLYNAHRRIVRQLGLPYIPLHGLRTSMATAISRHGGNMRSLQSILGHASYATTAKKYTLPDEEMLSTALDTVRPSMLSSTSVPPPGFTLTLNQGVQGSSP